MEYWQELRAALGHRPVLLVAGIATILDDEGRVLLIRRADSGLWALVGGMMELGETIEDTVRREVREEVGLEVGDLRLLGVLSGQESYSKLSNGDELYTLGIVHTTSCVGGELLPERAEVLEARWFRLDDVPADVTGRTMRYLQMYRGERNVPGCVACDGAA